MMVNREIHSVSLKVWEQLELDADCGNNILTPKSRAVFFRFVWTEKKNIWKNITESAPVDVCVFLFSSLFVVKNEKDKNTTELLGA